MKKHAITFLFVTSALALSSLIGCGNKRQPSSTPNESIPSSEAPITSVLPSSVPGVSSEAPKESSSNAPSSVVGSSSKPSSVEASSSQNPSSIISSSEQPSSSAQPSSSEAPSSSAQPSSSSQAPSSSEQPSSSEEPPVTLEYIDVELPDKTIYTTDDTELDLTGLVVIAHYSDGHTEVISEGYTVSTPDFSTPGQKPVYVTYQGSEVYFLINIVQAVHDWDDETKEGMKARLHGLVLPYADIEVGVRFLEDSIIIRSSENMDAGFLASYAALHEANGWYGGDNSDEVDEEPGSGVSYCYHKAVVVEGQKYVVESYFFGMDLETYSYSKTGTLFISALDPFVYSYPEEDISEYLNDTFDSNICPPSPEAEYYDMGSSENIICYCETNIEEAYRQTIADSDDYYLFADRDENGFYKAVAADGSYILFFKYDTNKGALILHFDSTYLGIDWPKDAIDAALNDLGFDFELPRFTISTFNYQLITDDENYDLVIGCLIGNRRIESAYASYGNFLVDNGFDKDPDTETYITTNLAYRVTLSDDDHYFYINIKENFGVWPSAELEEIYETLGFTNDYVPEPILENLPRARDYAISQKDDGSYLITCTYLPNDETYPIREAYARYLYDEYGFTQYFDGYGISWRYSPNKELCINAENDENHLSITFKPYVPSNGYAECMERIANALGSNYTVPELAVSDAIEYKSSTYFYFGNKRIGVEVRIEFNPDADINAKYQELVNSLNEQGFYYSRMYKNGAYINNENYNGFCPLVAIYPDSTTYLTIRVELADVSLDGYGLAMVEYDEEGNIYDRNYWCFYYDNENDIYMFDNDVVLHEGEHIFAYDFTNEVEFPISIDNRSLDSNWSDYLEFDNEMNDYVVLQDFTANFYFHLEEDNNYFYIGDFEVIAPTWANAFAALTEKLGSVLGTFDLSVGGVTYETTPYQSNSIILKLKFNPNAHNATELHNFTWAKLKEAGYRYGEGSGNMWNYHVMAHFWSWSDSFVSFLFEQHVINKTGYGIYRTTYDFFVAERADDAPGYDEQYVIRNCNLYLNQHFVFLNFDTAQELNVTIENAGDYIEYDSENNYYVVKQNFTADIYIKLKYGNDSVYFDFKS